MNNAMTLGDKITTVVGTILSALVTFGVLDAGQSDTISGLVVAGIAVVLALKVRPLGPAS